MLIVAIYVFDLAEQYNMNGRHEPGHDEA